MVLLMDGLGYHSFIILHFSENTREIEDSGAKKKEPHPKGVTMQCPAPFGHTLRVPNVLLRENTKKGA